MAIKAVVFDLGGVLEKVQDDAWPETWIGRWQRRMNLPAGHVTSVLGRREATGDMVTGGMSEAQIRELYPSALGLDEHEANQMISEMWDAYCGELNVALRDFAAGLRPRFTTAILSSSADGARREEQRRYGFEELVDVIVYSHEVGVAKPDPAIFGLTRDRLGVQSQEIVFLDDHEANVQAARACGWHAVLHTDTAVSIQEITRTIARANRPPLLECEARAPASAHIADRCWLLPPNNLSWPMLCPLSCRGHPAGCSGEGAAARLQGDRRTSHGDPIAAAASPQPSLPWAAHPGSGSIMGAPCAPPAERHQGRSMRGPSSAGRAGQLDPRHTCDPQAELDSRVARYRSTRRSGTSQMMATLVKVSIASQGLTKASAMPNRYRRGEILPLRSRPRA